MAPNMHFLGSTMASRPGHFARLSTSWGQLCRGGATFLTSLTSGFKPLVKDERGALTTEYVVVVGVVSLVVAGALVSVGPLLLASYERSRDILISPFP